jgi:hypothetical protein
MITMFSDDMTLDELLESVLYNMKLDRVEDTLANRLEYLTQVRDNWHPLINPHQDKEFANDFLVLIREINRLELLCLKLSYRGEVHKFYDICETEVAYD